MTYSTASRRVIPIAAPPAPKCFPTRDLWVSFLQSAQAVFRASERPFQGEHYRPTFNFCKECPASYRAQMEQEDRCELDSYAARVLADQPAQQTTQVVAEGFPYRPEPDATVPGKASAADPGLGVKCIPGRPDAQPEPQGKSQRGCETPAGACTPAGLCAGANP